MNLQQKIKNAPRRRPKGNLGQSIAQQIMGSGIDNRVLTLFGEVDHDTVQQLVHAIHSYNQFDDEQEQQLLMYERKPIYILINSPGGGVESGLSLVTSILNSTTPIITYSLGAVMSMAFIIYVSGHIRIATKESIFMYHQISGGSYGFIESIKEDIEYMNVLEKMMGNIITENTYLTTEKIESVNKQKLNWYMKHEEAEKYGVYDILIEETDDMLRGYINETGIPQEEMITVKKNKIKRLQDKFDEELKSKTAKTKTPDEPKTPKTTTRRKKKLTTTKTPVSPKKK